MKKFRRGFLSLELIITMVALMALAIPLFYIGNSIFKASASAELNKQLTKLQQGIELAAAQNVDSMVLSNEVIVKSQPDGDHIIIAKNKLVPMFSVERANGVIAETTPDGQGLKGNGSAVADTIRYINKLRSFWKQEFFNGNNTPYLYVAQRYFQTATGMIPYNDYYVFIMPSEISHALKTNKELRTKVFNTLLTVTGRSCSLKDSKNPFTTGEKVIDTTTCVNLQTFAEIAEAAEAGDKVVELTSLDIKKHLLPGEIKNMLTAGGVTHVSVDRFIELRPDIRLVRTTDKDIVLKAYDESIDVLKKMAKGAKDWASIEMNMHENTVAKIGGSFNIDYFISITDKSDNTPFNDYTKTSLYSATSLSKNDCGTRSTDVCWDTGNKIRVSTFTDSTNAGFVIQAFDYGLRDGQSSQPLNNILVLEKSKPVVTLNGTNSMVDVTLSSGLIVGSQSIMGVKGSENGFGNAFGNLYRYGFSNLATYSINDGVERGYRFTQNVPENKDKYAPFSATFNTIFPWIYYSIKPTDNFFGYYEERIVPELR